MISAYLGYQSPYELDKVTHGKPGDWEQEKKPVKLQHSVATQESIGEESQISNHRRVQSGATQEEGSGE